VLQPRRYKQISIENLHFRWNGVSVTKISDTMGQPPPTVLRVRKLG